MIAGEAWTGKSTCSEILYKEFTNSAWLDGDDVWRVNPFTVKDSRLRNSDCNMAYVLNNYLESGFEYVFFSSIVLCNLEIREKILSLISAKSFEIYFFTLIASKQVLTGRAIERDSNRSPQFHLLEESLKQDSIFIDTSRKTPEEVASEIKSIV